MNHREREIFFEAVEITSTDERLSFLDKACAGDGLMRDRVQALLKAHENGGSFMAGAEPPKSSASSESSSVFGRMEGPGSTVGRYRLLEKIGEGGFGVVYMAEQREPVKRKVALKIIKLGMDTKQVVARFEAERQALAMMEHPNIARVLDAGATEMGRPYFVMELVRGVPITQFCDQNNFTTTERLRLFIPICEAIQHAHQKGIVHRDIKPNNVLITMHDDRAVPKVIDFGIAKAIGHELTDKTVFTRFHEFLGTPAYMSPEQTQLNGLDIDTRSDIYSLGVLLYELLTGNTPFDAKELLSASYDEIRRLIREREPLKPSTHLNTLAIEDRTRIARHRNSDPHQLRRALKGDLDWVVMKAMEKDRSRRYESASAFAHDIGRYLREEPVSAVAPSLGYRLRKFGRRHRTALTVASIVAILLVISTLVSTWLAVRATHAERIARALLEAEQHSSEQLGRMLGELRDSRHLAEKEAERARAQAATADAVARFVGEELFGSADPEREPNRDLTLRAVLDRASPLLYSSLDGQPLVAASLHTTVGRAYRNLGLYSEAIEHCRKAYELYLGASGERHESTLSALMLYAHALHMGGQRQESIPLILKASGLVREVLGSDHPLHIRCMVQLAWMRWHNSEIEEAYSLAEGIYQQALENPRVAESDLISAMHLLARKRGASNGGRFEDGEALFRQVVKLSHERRGDDHPQTLRAKLHLAAFLYDSNRKLDEAEKLYLETLAVQRRVLGESHDHTLMTRENLALLYNVLRRPSDTLAQYLAILQFRPLQLRALDSMPHLLEQVSLRELVAPADSADWLMTTNAPDANWTSLDFDAQDWRKTSQPNTVEAWFRRDLNLAHLPAQPLVFRIGNAGDFEVFINGVRAVDMFGSVRKQFQLAVCNPAGMKALRPGHNVIAFHASRLRPSQNLSFGIYEFLQEAK